MIYPYSLIPHNPITSSQEHSPPGFHNNAFSAANNHHFLIFMLLSLHRNVGLMRVRVIFPIHLCLHTKCVSWKVSLDTPSFCLVHIKVWLPPSLIHFKNQYALVCLISHYLSVVTFKDLFGALLFTHACKLMLKPLY